MSYGLDDIKQSALGTLLATLFFFMLRAGDPIIIDPKIGLVIGIIWLYITGKPFLTKNYESKKHFIGNILVALVVSTSLTVVFEVATLEQLMTFQFFGSAAWLGMLLGIKSAQFFDKMNITNFYSTWYHKKVK